ncbi:MAG: hypothetical protein HY286_16870 [Planctomycetes bacterium]|nr:hypothetical protein [Planctomycetota bacterium]
MGILTIFALPFLLLQASKPAQPAPSTAVEQRLDEAMKKLAREHVAIAQFSAGKTLYLQAFRDYESAARLDPANADAAKGCADLKDKKDGGDREAKMKLIAEIDKKRKTLATKAAAELKTLGDAAAKAKDDRSAKRAWIFLLTYDPDSTAANAGLGKVKKGNAWFDAREIEINDAVAKCLLSAREGTPFKSAHRFDAALGTTLTKIRSDHFEIFGSIDAKSLANLSKLAEAAQAFMDGLIGTGGRATEGTVTFVFLTTEAEHEKFVDAFTPYTPEQKVLVKKTSGAWTFNPPGYEAWESGGSFETFKDAMVHRAVGHFSIFRFVAMADAPKWIYEGLGIWLSFRFVGYARTYCTGGGPAADAMNSYRDLANWKTYIHDAVRDGTDAPIRELFAVRKDELSPGVLMKCWSVVDYMIREQPEAFAAMVHKLKDLGNDRAILESFKLKSVDELETAWREFVREKY